MSADKTERMPSPHGTLIRPAQPAGPDDQTRLRPSTDAPDAAPTQIEGPATVERTQRVEPSGETRQHDPDATVRTHRETQETAARTLKADASADAYAATLQAAAAGAETKVMHNRPARALEAEEGHRGPLEPGAVIKKRFVLETLLGKGGMGLVYGAIDRRKEEARDPNPHVALKVLSADFQRHPQSFIALQREARKAQTLAHPNVVTVFDFDRDGDAVYMTMELLQGRTLDSLVREARGKGVGRDVAMPIIRGIAEGLAYAHRKNIVHSDLKPGNVLITEDGTAKILDFGIARAVPSAVVDEHRDVFDAGALGAYTEAYATDEMIDGVDPHPADDMYALGIIAYELMTGLHPYQRHSAPGARKLGMKPAPLKGLKRKQARAIESCLSFDRRQRPQNAGEFLKAFRGVTALQKATRAATVVLTLAAGYFWRENYLETSPSIPFEELSFEQQQHFREYMRQGNKAWTFYEREHLVNALSDDAIGNYARAYDIHPRNRDAVAALNRTADTLLEEAGDSEDKRREIARVLQETSGLRQYPPVVEAAR
jgi:serine/threonine protein kinase